MWSIMLSLFSSVQKQRELYWWPALKANRLTGKCHCEDKRAWIYLGASKWVLGVGRAIEKAISHRHRDAQSCLSIGRFLSRQPKCPGRSLNDLRLAAGLLPVRGAPRNAKLNEDSRTILHLNRLNKRMNFVLKFGQFQSNLANAGNPC